VSLSSRLFDLLRLQRLVTALLVVASLLFAQFALASYVCPVEADMDMMVEMMEAGQPCDGHDTVQPLLCHEHAADTAQAVQQATPTPAASAPALLQAFPLAVLPVTTALRPLQGGGGDARVARPPPDPLFLATLRLRV
jgi:hypothetical protein